MDNVFDKIEDNKGEEGDIEEVDGYFILFFAEDFMKKIEHVSDEKEEMNLHMSKFDSMVVVVVVVVVKNKLGDGEGVWLDG